MQPVSLMPRRTFLLGAAAVAASCSRIRKTPASLGTLAYVDVENLWLRGLPYGKPRLVATGHRIAWPRFSPSGRWIAFQDGSAGRVVSTQAAPAQGAQWNTGERGESPLKWIGERDELAVRLVNPQSGDPGDRLQIFHASDRWRTPQRSISLGLDADTGWGIAVDKGGDRYACSSTTALPRQNADGSGRFKTALLLNSLRQPSESKTLAESEGFFDIAGFTPSGEWLLFWRSEEISASIREDGLNFLAVNLRDGKSRDPKIMALMDEDMVAISPARDMAAVTAGAGRETWSNKSIVIVDLTGGELSVRELTGPSEAAQLPAWSFDGAKLAWCAGPDAGFLYKRKLLATGQKTISVEGPRTGEHRQIPITPELLLGADSETADRCLRLRRIYAANLGTNERPRQLTNDPRYADEEPAWSADGSHILFCRVDSSHVNAQAAWSIWLMRSDGSEVRPMAGPLRPPPDLTDLEKFSYKTYYGHTDWRSLFDWRR
jgi:Tol biopolymer transport system component